MSEITFSTERLYPQCLRCSARKKIESSAEEILAEKGKNLKFRIQIRCVQSEQNGDPNSVIFWQINKNTIVDGKTVSSAINGNRSTFASGGKIVTCDANKNI